MELYYFICFIYLCGFLWGVDMYKVKYCNIKVCESIILLFKDYREINRYFKKYDLEIADGMENFRSDDCRINIVEI